MSKMDGLRAMRAARFENAQAQATSRPTVVKPPVQRAASAVEADTTPAAVEDVEAESEDRLCGHRAISGRTCTREHGHSAKSHRYS